MKILFYLIVLYALSMTGCKDNSDYSIGGGGESRAKHYIGKYRETDSIDAGIYQFSQPQGKLRIIDSVALIFKGNVVGVYAYKDKERFDYYSSFYGDTAYNRPNNLMAGAVYVADYWESVNLTCNKDYDAGHPAGTSLNDIVRLQSRSAYHFIKNGYWKEELTFWQHFLHDKLMSELTREDLLLMVNAQLIFNSQPTELKPMVFTLTWKAQNKTVTTTFTNVVK